MQKNKIDFIHCFKDAFLAGLLALLIFIPIRGMIIDGWELNFQFFYPFLFSGIIFIVRLLLNISYQIKPINQLLKKIFRQKILDVVVESGKKSHTTALLITAIFVMALIFPFVASKYWIAVMTLAFIYILLGLGLNIVVGMAGMLDLGFVAFYAVGAYSLGLLHQYLALGFWSILPIAIIISGLTGVLLGFPVLRMHGDYLAIVTLGFGEIIRLILNNWLEVTGGPNGLSTPRINLFGLGFKKRSENSFFDYFGIEFGDTILGISTRNFGAIFLYLVLLVFVIAIIFFVVRLGRMPLGRAWEALREDQIACQSLGLNHVTVKLTAFCFGASIGGMAGVFFGASQGFINPHSFNFFESALIVAIVVLGGLGSIPGVVVAAILFTVMPEIFRAFSDFRVLVFGLIMVIMMIWRPKGLLRVVRTRFTHPRKQSWQTNRTGSR